MTPVSSLKRCLTMTESHNEKNRRVLVIDDNRAIHEDFCKILVSDSDSGSAFHEAEASLFGEAAAKVSRRGFEVDSAFQGREGLEQVEKAVGAGRRYAMAFVDV